MFCRDCVQRHPCTLLRVFCLPTDAAHSRTFDKAIRSLLSTHRKKTPALNEKKKLLTSIFWFHIEANSLIEKDIKALCTQPYSFCLQYAQQRRIWKQSHFFPSQKQAWGDKSEKALLILKPCSIQIKRWIQTCGLVAKDRRRIKKLPVVGKHLQVQIIWHSKKQKFPCRHRRGHLYIDQRAARGRDDMKNRSDVAEGRKGKCRQRAALMAGWQTKQQHCTGRNMKMSHNDVEKLCKQSSKGNCVSLRWDVHVCM